MSSAPSPRAASSVAIVPCVAPGCPAAATAKCRACLVAAYCGATCAAADWPTHKPACVRAEVDRLTAERAAAAAAAARDAFDSAVGECAAAACARKAIARCTRCRRAGYCGVACQTAHWPAHKAQCRLWSAEAGAAGTMVVYGAEAPASRGTDAAPASAAAAAGAARASTELWKARMMLWCNGDPTPDSTQVRRWQEAAALRGDLDAQCMVGFAFMHGWAPAERSHVKAVAWFRKAADAGQSLAQLLLGLCYDLGIGLAKDTALAIPWFVKAAAQGLAPAQFILGTCYASGRGVAANAALAASWYAKAAAQGFTKQQFAAAAFLSVKLGSSALAMLRVTR